MHGPSDTRVLEYRPLPRPEELAAAWPRTAAQERTVTEARQAIRRILAGDDPRLLAIVGPCSIHDLPAARDYARQLAPIARAVSDRMLVVMRVYFEKPRTTQGWKGLILDPHLDETGDIAQGLSLARAFLREVLDLGLPTATEFLDPISPQYIADLVCWSAIGARTTESQAHRQLASGLSMPVGFKNPTSGKVQHAVNAIRAAAESHTFLGLSPDGRPAAVRTRGNPDCHLVLRGGDSGPNYEPAAVAAAEAALQQAGLRRGIVVDCSHDNSGRKPHRQPAIVENLVAQLRAGRKSIVGLMLESNLFAGNQPVPATAASLRYGISITDPCLDWDSTERCLRGLHAALAFRFAPTPAAGVGAATSRGLPVAALTPFPAPAVG